MPIETTANKETPLERPPPRSLPRWQSRLIPRGLVWAQLERISQTRSGTRLHKAHKRSGQPAPNPSAPSLSRPKMLRQPRQVNNSPCFPAGKLAGNAQNPNGLSFPNYPHPYAPHPQAVRPIPLMGINTYPLRPNSSSGTQCQLCLGWAHTPVTCHNKEATCYKYHTIGHFSQACPYNY